MTATSKGSFIIHQSILLHSDSDTKCMQGPLIYPRSSLQRGMARITLGSTPPCMILQAPRSEHLPNIKAKAMEPSIFST